MAVERGSRGRGPEELDSASRGGGVMGSSPSKSSCSATKSDADKVISSSIPRRDGQRAYPNISHCGLDPPVPFHSVAELSMTAS